MSRPILFSTHCRRLKSSQTQAKKATALSELLSLLHSGKRSSVREAVLALYQRWQEKPSEQKNIAAQLAGRGLPDELLRKLVCNSVQQPLLDATLFVCALGAEPKLFSEVFACMEHFSNSQVFCKAVEQLSSEQLRSLVDSLPSLRPAQQQMLVEALANGHSTAEKTRDNLLELLAYSEHLTHDVKLQLIEIIGEKSNVDAVEALLRVGVHGQYVDAVTTALQQIARRKGPHVQQTIVQQAQRHQWPQLEKLQKNLSSAGQGAAILHGPAISMDARTFSELAALVRADSGLELVESVRSRVVRRVQKRMDALSLSNLEHYLRLLKKTDPQGAQERRALTELLTVHETYFFREPRQLRAVESEILPDLIRLHRADKSLRLWSAGCSSGEEAYTLAMLLHHRQELRGWDLQIRGSDISAQVVQKARRACYSENSFRENEASKGLLDFERRGDLYCLRDEIKRRVAFQVENIVESSRQPAHQAQYDLIMCRNVFIYFAPQTQRRVAAMFYQQLRPGGYLLLGHAESLLSYALDFEVVTLRDDLVYRRPLGDQERM